MIVRRKEEGKVFPVVPGVRFMLPKSWERIMFVLVEMGEGSTMAMHMHPQWKMGL